MKTERSTKEWLLLATLVVVWGSAFLLIKLAVDSIPPLTAVAARLVLGLAVLYPIMIAMGISLPPIVARTAAGVHVTPHWLYFGFVGFVGNALPFSLVMWGQTEIDSGLAGIFMAFAPLTTIALAHMLIPGERLTPLKGTGFLMGFAGICVLMGPAALTKVGRAGSFGHELAVLAGALSYGVSNVMARKMPPIHPVAASTGVMIAAVVFMVPVALVVDRPWTIEPTTLSLVMTLLLGLLPTGLANVVFFVLINTAGASFASLSNYLLPLWAIFMGALFLHEPLQWTALVALVLILGGVALSQAKTRMITVPHV